MPSHQLGKLRHFEGSWGIDLDGPWVCHLVWLGRFPRDSPLFPALSGAPVVHGRCQRLPVRCGALGRSAVSVRRARDQGGVAQKRSPSHVGPGVPEASTPLQTAAQRSWTAVRITSCDACSHASSARPGHASSSHPDEGGNVPCLSTSCSDSDLRPPLANRTSPASTHPRSPPLPLVRFASRHPASGTQPAQSRARGRRSQAMRAHAGRYVGSTFLGARFPTVVVGWCGSFRVVHLRSWAVGCGSGYRLRSGLNGAE